MKNILKIIFLTIFSPYIRIYEIRHEIINRKNLEKLMDFIGTVLLPIIIIYSIFYLFIIIFSFLLWMFPYKIPIPFYNFPILDRFLLFIGLVIYINK